jgi:photosystem II stability/assembly factor-like uncharacterized protein
VPCGTFGCKDPEHSHVLGKSIVPELHARMGRLGVFVTTSVAMSVALVGSTAVAVSEWHPAAEMVGSLAIDPAHRGVIYAGTGSGVYRTNDGGSSWSLSSRGIGRPVVLDLAIDPRSWAVYAVASTGVYKSTDAGATWKRRLARGDLVRIAIDPSNSGTLYVGAMNAVLKSTDGGVSWRRALSFRSGRWALAVVIDPERTATVYAGTGAGVFKSTDGGVHWGAASRGLPAPSGRDRFEGYVRALAIDPANPSTVYLGTERGFFRSLDSGESWASDGGRSAPKVVAALAADPRRPRVLYAGTFDGIVKSTDGGRTWRDSTLGLRRPYVLEHPSIEAIAVEPASHRVYAAGTWGVFRSGDGGGRWQLASPFTPPVARRLAEHCDATHALCLRVIDVQRVPYFEITAPKTLLDDYMVCVRRMEPADAGREFCVVYQMERRFGRWSSFVRYTQQFPQLGAGSYLVTWKLVEGGPLGPSLQFRLPLD